MVKKAVSSLLFLNVPAATVDATGKFIQHTGADIITFSYHRDRDDMQYTLYASMPLENHPSGNSVADATRINRLLENAIRQHPEQYMWTHRRFKTRPPGEPAIY